MNNRINLPLLLTRVLVDSVAREMEQTLQNAQAELEQLALNFIASPVNPQATFDFEHHLQSVLNKLGQQITEFAYNSVELDASAAPKHMRWEGGIYRRLNKKTANRHVATLFGKVTLARFPYRDDQTGDGCFFPLERRLGLVHGATPALADRAAKLVAETGATQRRVREKLKQDHGVNWGVKKLRQFTQAYSALASQCRNQAQCDKVLQLLEQAQQSRGKTKPVLSVGRDGVTIHKQTLGVWEVASAATVTVYDRRGKRLGTVYLGFAPESCQPTMTRELTRLIKDVLTAWTGPLPRLCYVTDCGDNETAYYEKVLSKMDHPRTGERLSWRRTVDYFHASERISTMAEKLFGGQTREASSWARRMRKLLLKPNGLYRVLHSAAALKSRKKLRGRKKKDFDRAYQFLRSRSRYMNYAECRRYRLPIGSGVTESACKTLFAQRLKLSGMHWENEGAQWVLDLRSVYLSGIWNEVRSAVLSLQNEEQPETYSPKQVDSQRIAA